MHHRHDVNAISVDSIQQTIRKFRNENAPEAAVKSTPDQWLFGYSLVCPLNNVDEMEAEPSGVLFVEPGG